VSLAELVRKWAVGDAPLPPIAQLLGIQIKTLEPGHSLLEMDVDERHANPLGTLHGGIYCDLADLAMGLAYAATLQEGESFTTIELKINFLRPVQKARLIAEARVLQAGRTVALVECDVRDEKERSVARTWCTCMKLLTSIGT
jgi:uncharacterized protein (TIGR00369 family)